MLDGEKMTEGLVRRRLGWVLDGEKMAEGLEGCTVVRKRLGGGYTW